MIWNILLLLSLVLVSARNIESEFLDEAESALEQELSRYEQSEEARGDETSGFGRIKFTKVSHLGDILLTDEQARQGLNFDKYTGSRWPNGRVPYVYQSGHFTRSERRKIDWAIEEFNRRLADGGKMKIVKRSNEKDYVKVINGNGCYSYLGRVGGEQTLSLQKNGCIYNTTIQHEFMHAMGFTHEQNRADRDEYVDVLWDNIPEDWHSQYNKVEEEDYKKIGPYEWYSIMHYPWWAPDSGGKDAFNIKGENIDKYRLGNGENDGPTQTDLYKINHLYD